MEDKFVLGGVELRSRLFMGTGKYASDDLIPKVAEASGAEVVTVAMRRVDPQNRGIMAHIPEGMRLLPNTSGARTADEAVRLARIARAAGCGTSFLTGTPRPKPRRSSPVRALPSFPTSTPTFMWPGPAWTPAPPASCPLPLPSAPTAACAQRK